MHSNKKYVITYLLDNLNFIAIPSTGNILVPCVKTCTQQIMLHIQSIKMTWVIEFQIGLEKSLTKLSIDYSNFLNQILFGC